jgi:hypothetical protein
VCHKRAVWGKTLLFVLRWGRGFVRQMLAIQDGVEDQRVGADGFAAIDGVVAEQQHASLPQVRVHHHGVLGDRGTLVLKAVEQLSPSLAPFFEQAGLHPSPEKGLSEMLLAVTPLIRERIKLLRDAVSAADFFFLPQLAPYDPAELIPKKAI